MPWRCKWPSSPHTVVRLACPCLLGLAIDWTIFDTTLPFRERMHYQVLRMAVLGKGRATPHLRLASDRDRLRPKGARNQLEQDAMLAVVKTLPPGVRTVVLAIGLCRASCLVLLEYQSLHTW